MSQYKHGMDPDRVTLGTLVWIYESWLYFEMCLSELILLTMLFGFSCSVILWCRLHSCLEQCLIAINTCLYIINLTIINIQGNLPTYNFKYVLTLIYTTQQYCGFSLIKNSCVLVTASTCRRASLCITCIVSLLLFVTNYCLTLNGSSVSCRYTICWW